MNKLKRATNALRDYLGRDKQGIDLLDSVTRAVEETRKETATLREFVQQSDERISNRDQTIENLRKQVEALNIDLESSRASAKQVESEYARLKAEEKVFRRYRTLFEERVAGEEVECPTERLPQMLSEFAVKDTVDLSPDSPGFIRAFKQMLEERNHEATPLLGVDIDEIIEDFSPFQLQKLGRRIAVMAIATKRPFEVRCRYSGSLPDALVDKLLDWVGPHILWDTPRDIVTNPYKYGLGDKPEKKAVTRTTKNERKKLRSKRLKA
jgi:hypothetical protein